MITRPLAPVSAFRCDTAGAVRTVYRHDRGEALLPSSTTPEGFLLCEARVAKPGILQYTNADGSMRRELIAEDSLSDATSLATLARKPVTIEHPDEPVNSRNVGELGVGDIDGEVVYSDGYVKVRLCVRRADALDAIRRGKQEVSPGYAIDLDETPGVHPTFGAYDAVQLRRRYNHLAITDAARGGIDIRLRADGSAVDSARRPPSTPGETMDPILLILCGKLGVKFRKDAQEAMAAELGSAVDAMSSKVDELTAKATDLGAAQAKVATLEAELKAAKEAMAAMSGPKDPGAQIDAVMEADPVATEECAPGAVMTDAQKCDSIRKAVARQIALRGRLDSLAMGHGITAADAAKLGNLSLRKAIVAKANPGARADGTADYYAAAIDMLPSGRRADGTANPPNPYDGVTDAFRVNVGGQGGGEGGDRPDPKRNDTAAAADEVDPFVANVRRLRGETAAK